MDAAIERHPKPEKSMFNTGDKVMITTSNCINDRAYLNVPGTVDFQANAGLVYVSVKLKGQRKARSIVTHQDNLIRI